MKKFLGLLCIASSIFGMELDIIKGKQLFVPERLGSIDVYHNDKGFSVYRDDKKHDIKKYHMDPVLRNINKKQLQGFLKNGYLSVNQMDDGEYSLKAKGRVNGGGPILGVAAYWITKCLCYGVLAAGVTASMGGAGLAVGTGGVITSSNKERAINAAQDVGAGVVNLGLTALATTATVPLVTTGTVTSTALVAGASGTGAGIALVPLMTTGKIVSSAAMGGHIYGAGLVSTAITGAGCGQAATLVSAAGITSTAGTSLGVVGTIEAISLKIGLFFGMTPTL
jgi:hypothetical protein